MSKSRSAGLAAARKMALEILEHKDYKEMLLARANAGTLPSAMESLLYYYAYGKPADYLEVSEKVEDLRGKQLDELLDEASTLQQQLKDAIQAREAAREMIKLVAETRAADEAKRQQDVTSNVHFADFGAAAVGKRTH